MLSIFAGHISDSLEIGVMKKGAVEKLQHPYRYLQKPKRLCLSVDLSHSAYKVKELVRVANLIVVP